MTGTEAYIFPPRGTVAASADRLLAGSMPDGPDVYPACDRKPKGAVTPRLNYYVYALLLTLFLPREFDFHLFGTQLTAYRIVLLLSLPVILRIYIRTVSTRFVYADVFVFLYSFWGALSHVVNAGMADTPDSADLSLWDALSQLASAGIAGGGASAGLLVIETVGPYLLARLYITNIDKFNNLTKFITASVIILFFLAAAESISADYLVRGISASITGQSYLFPMEARLGGLGRAMGPFDHPILYGTYCASALGIMWYYYGGFKKLLYGLIFIGAVFWSMSSGPLLGVAFQSAFVSYERVTRIVRYRVLLLVLGSALVLLLLQAASNRPLIEVAISDLTLDPQTAWCRVAIWQYASQTIGDHPLLGIAFQGALYDASLPDWMQFGLKTMFSSSVDSFPLANALLYGLPAAGFLIAAAASAIYRVAAVRRENLIPRIHAASMGWTCSFLALCFVSITVHYWGPMHVFFFFILGSGAWLGDRFAVMHQDPG